MLCQQCQKRVANVHYTQIVNGKKVELHLCEQCVNEKGQLGIGSQLNLGDFLWGLHSLGGNINYQQPEKPEEVRCPVCNMSFGEFRKTGRLGCSNCYSVFRDDLNTILKRIHGSTEHKGKTPAKAEQSKKTVNELEKLKNELSEAISSEEYEKAALLRDKIRELEGTANPDGGVQDGAK